MTVANLVLSFLMLLLRLIVQQVTRNEDGSIDLHLYVDRASVEVFAKGNTVAGANQIFPSPRAVGASVLVERWSSQSKYCYLPN